MQYHQVPPDTRDKEKIFGGIFTITQFVFLVIGVVLGAIMGLFFYTITQNIIVMAFAFTMGFGVLLPFAFVKIHKMGDMELFRYLVLKVKFSKRIKHMPHININQGGK